MIFKDAIKNQHFAALAMLRQSVEVCPEDLWLGGTHPRNYWRIAYHAAGYAHLYLYNGMEDWKPWDLARNDCAILEGDVEVAQPYTREQMLNFIDLIVSEVAPQIEKMDFDAPRCGFTWYPQVTRFELTVLSLRHLHGHIGQLTELLIARGLDVEWLGPAPSL